MTGELPSRHAPLDPLVITFSDAAYLPLLEIWLARMRQLGVAPVRVYCLDAPTLAWCRSEGVACELVRWSGSLQDLWLQRVRIISSLLATGQEIIHSDTDAVWTKNPLREGSARLGEQDLMFSQGTVWPDDVHDRWGFVLCCGWFRARPSPAACRFFQALEVDIAVTADDQISVNRLLLAWGVQWKRSTSDYRLSFRDRTVQCWHSPLTATAGSLSVALLPHREFQRLPEPGGGIVKHYLTPKDCTLKIEALRAHGLL